MYFSLKSDFIDTRFIWRIFFFKLDSEKKRISPTQNFFGIFYVNNLENSDIQKSR